MPVGYLVSLALVTTAVALVLAPPAPSRGARVVAATVATVVNEVPLLPLAPLGHATLLAVVDDGLLAAPAGWLLLGTAAAVGLALLELLRRGWRARETVSRALDHGLGGAHRPRGTRPPWLTLLTPFPLRPKAVRRLGNLSYGPGGRRNRLDVY